MRHHQWREMHSEGGALFLESTKTRCSFWGSWSTVDGTWSQGGPSAWRESASCIPWCSNPLQVREPSGLINSAVILPNWFLLQNLPQTGWAPKQIGENLVWNWIMMVTCALLRSSRHGSCVSLESVGRKCFSFSLVLCINQIHILSCLQGKSKQRVIGS